jgi:hypothetical protein
MAMAANSEAEEPLGISENPLYDARPHGRESVSPETLTLRQMESARIALSVPHRASLN